VFSSTDLQVSEFLRRQPFLPLAGITTSYSKDVVQLMYDQSFSVNGWLTAGMIYLLPLISVPSLVLPAVICVHLSHYLRCFK